ncbi:50S ribosomal protein L10 [Macrococcus lamae]|uniref:Large ribosomal subunit protein uL10 n=1 Tax=Macrococcus lamae TaxID=198484 RepID=A0A4V3BEZ3_9STAP|nr:50S ribosomal protein L10 [Macrococcus lamae]
MSKAVELKQQKTEVITEQFKNSVSTIIVDYRGLTVAQVTELRKQLREAGIEFHVYKNTMVRRAAQAAGVEGIEEFLTGPNAIAFSNEEVVAPAKIIADFAKTNEKLEIKAGIIEGKVTTDAEVKAIASLPSKEGLISMVLSVLQAPMRNFAYAVKAVGEQKDTGTEAAAPAETPATETAEATEAPAAETTETPEA